MTHTSTHPLQARIIYIHLPSAQTTDVNTSVTLSGRVASHDGIHKKNKKRLKPLSSLFLSCEIMLNVQHKERRTRQKPYSNFTLVLNPRTPLCWEDKHGHQLHRQSPSLFLAVWQWGGEAVGGVAGKQWGEQARVPHPCLFLIVSWNLDHRSSDAKKKEQQYSSSSTNLHLSVFLNHRLSTKVGTKQQSFQHHLYVFCDMRRVKEENQTRKRFQIENVPPGRAGNTKPQW